MRSIDTFLSGSASALAAVLVLGAVACGGQDAALQAPATESSEPAASAGPEPVEETDASPATTAAPEPVEPVDAATATSPAPDPSVPADPDPQSNTGSNGEAARALEGRWEGAISIPGPTDLPFAVELVASEEGLRGTIDLQGFSGLPLSNLALDGDGIHFELQSPLGLAVWDGDVSDGVIEGEFTQAGLVEAFWLQRFEDPAGGDGEGVAFRREEVTFSNGEIVLAGELTFPEGEGPHPAVVMISGSGAQDRDSDLGGFRLFAVLADHLAGTGIASLRFDDRGVGGSTGDNLQATLLDRAGDVEAALGLLRSHHDIAAGRVGLVGHSEGGIVAPLVANRSDGVAFVALLAAPAVSAEEILVAQQRTLLEDSDSTAEEAEQFRVFQELVFRATATGQGWDQAEASMRALVMQQFEAFPEQTQEAVGDVDAFVDAIVVEQMATWQSPWFESFFKHDPRPSIAALQVPVIALFGELDTQVPAAANATAMSEAINESSAPGYTIATIVSANHGFQEAVTGSMDEYARLKREFAPDFLEILTTWLTEVSGL